MRITGKEININLITRRARVLYSAARSRTSTSAVMQKFHDGLILIVFVVLCSLSVLYVYRGGWCFDKSRKITFICFNLNFAFKYKMFNYIHVYIFIFHSVVGVVPGVFGSPVTGGDFGSKASGN